MMPQISPPCGFCRSTEKMERLSRRTYGINDKTGKQKPWGWVCTVCGAVRVDEGIVTVTNKTPFHWIYRGKYA